MLTHPAAAARAAVATGVRDKIDTHVSETWKRASLSYIAAHPPADLTKKKRESIRLMIGTCTSSTSLIKLVKKLITCQISYLIAAACTLLECARQSIGTSTMYVHRTHRKRLSPTHRGIDGFLVQQEEWFGDEGVSLVSETEGDSKSI